MKQQTALLAVAAVGGALALFVAQRRAANGTTLSGAAERASGVQALYAASTGQQAGLNGAVAASWQQLQDSVFKSQPDFWV